LYLTHARERRLYGSREPAISSQFLTELPEELLSSRQPTGRVSSNQLAGSSQQRSRSVSKGDSRRASKDTAAHVSTSQAQNWKVGDRILHNTFGVGEITHIFGSGNKISLAIKFPSLGQKIIDPKIAQLQRVE
jgi:DNA helicase-2/ATP-dependent DNA helicase PcrA